MAGNANCRGVMVQTVEELYKRIEASASTQSIDVTVSYLEVYNEKIRDLLRPGKELAVRDDAKQGS